MKKEEKKKKSDVAKREEEILAFWEKEKIFEKSLNKDAPNGEFVFYDGPPFATGLPHYGHILPGTVKDVIPRYKTMRGFRVNRRWGWDCHGLPLENLVEKELNLKSKKDIEELGILKFNNAARDSVLRYADDWKKIIPRMGRWVDMERDYKTMDTNYTESVWWVFKTLYDKGFIYEGFKSMHICPRCETTLSNFEVNQGYKDIKDFAVTVKLELEDEPGTYLLIWTTTAWTLPGNMASAVHREALYAKIKMKKEKGKSGDEYVIIAKDRVKNVVGDMKYEIIKEFKGEELIGKKYKPPFDYFTYKDIKGKDNAWKVYHASYVSTEDGTGIVHIAPAFGEEDMELAKQEEIPLVHHVGTDGKFTKDVKDFEGLLVKPKDDHQKTDIEIIKHLAHRELLFKKEKITHSYPHCWRCDTPLINYATSSWFVKVTAIKKLLIAENKKIHWVPKEVRDGRFGKGLEVAPDWAISRSRYWGAPLPVWKHPKSGAITTVGSIQELRTLIKHNNNVYTVMRHGESVSNVESVISSRADNNHPLTDVGREQVRGACQDLKKKHIDVIIMSPFMRTKETAKIVAESLGIANENVIEDRRLGEINLGVLNNKKDVEYTDFAVTYEERFTKTPEGGENLSDVKKRVGELLYETEEKYKKKNILFVTHDYTAWMVFAVALGANQKEAIVLIGNKNDFISTAEIQKLDFVPLPHNEYYEVDLHKPFIDEIRLLADDGMELKRIPDVFDCWFESGSVPYGQHHYPFENTDVFEPEKNIGFPADFIAESIDQTRGWFYSMLVLSVALFGKSSYKSVITNGLVLAEDGHKMSKKLQNYPDPSELVNTYGADAMRYYLLSSSILKGEDLNFSEKGVAEVMRKVIIRLSNVYSFYKLYSSNLKPKSYKLKADQNILDVWIISRLNQLISGVTDAMEGYEIERATRPIAEFIDDLSTWYLRRSRDRFKGDDIKDKERALHTTQHVFIELSKIMAPFMPFFADWLYREVGGNKESVHLENWKFPARSRSAGGEVGSCLPARGAQAGKLESGILKEMEEVRRIVSVALEARAETGIKVRQPLASLKLKIKNEKLKNDEQLLQLIKDEVNVKEVIFDDSLPGDVEFDTRITPELKEEGDARELIRHIQNTRKKVGLTPSDTVSLVVDTDEKGKALIQKFEKEIKKTALLKEIRFEKTNGEKIEIDSLTFTINLKPKT